MSAFANLMRHRSGGVLRAIISQMRSAKPSENSNTDKENADSAELTNNKEVERQSRITPQTYRQLRNNNNVNAAAAARSNAAAALARLKAKRERVPRIELTEHIIQEYVQLERLIHGLERRNLLKKLEAKVIFADELQKSAVHPQDAMLKELKRQTERKRSKYEKIQDPFFRETLNSNWQQRFDAEKQEYEEALARERAAEEQLKAAKQRYERAAKIIDIFRRQCETLGDAYERQRQIFVGIFGADFVSARLDEVELEMEATLDMQRRVLDTKFMWLNGRELLVHAQTQLAFGVSKWSELLEIEPSKTRTRYNAAAEAANIFSAAAQNIQSCRVYMGYIRFPHASEDDMTQLETATQNALNAIHVGTAQSNDAVRRRAFNVFRSTHQKVVALIQWFDRIINDDILKTLDRTNTNITKRRKQLRELRLELMRQRVRDTALPNADQLMDISHDDASAAANDAEEEDEEELLRSHTLQEAIESQEQQQQQRRLSKAADRLNGAAIGVVDEDVDTGMKRPPEDDDTAAVAADAERVTSSASTTTSSQRRQQILAAPNRELLLREARHIIANYEATRMLLRQQDEMERRRQRAAIQVRLRFHRRKAVEWHRNGDATSWTEGGEHAATVNSPSRGFLPPLGGAAALTTSSGERRRVPQSRRIGATLPPIAPPAQPFFSPTDSGGETSPHRRRRPPQGRLTSSASSSTTSASSSPRDGVDVANGRQRTTESGRSLRRHDIPDANDSEDEAEEEEEEDEEPNKMEEEE